MLESGVFSIPGEPGLGGAFTIGATTGGMSPINMQAANLDPRVQYTGPAHYYWAQGGGISKSADNVWPLEYRNGVLMGRHEPEPASTNYQVRNRANAESANVVKSANLNWVIDPTAGPDGGSAARVPVMMDSYLVSQDNGGDQLVPLTMYSLTNAWTRLQFSITNTQASRIRTWLGRTSTSQDGSPFLYLTQGGNLAIRNWVFSWFARNNSDGTTFTPTLVQVEYDNAPYATSPIINEAGDVGTRAASNVVVTKQGDATGIVVYFSDGSNQAYSFGAASSVTLDKAKSHWGTRYITRIEYRRP